MMPVPNDTWVPKVHPLTRGVEAEDPMELVATPVVGDADLMLDAVVQEFSQMGFGAAELLEMFRSEAYPVLRELGGQLGEAELKRRIDAALAPLGAYRVREIFLDEGEDAEDEGNELITLTVRRREAQP
jgi:hypothetical protein